MKYSSALPNTNYQSVQSGDGDCENPSSTSAFLMNESKDHKKDFCNYANVISAASRHNDKSILFVSMMMVMIMSAFVIVVSTKSSCVDCQNKVFVKELEKNASEFIRALNNPTMNSSIRASNTVNMANLVEPGCEGTILILRHCEKFVDGVSKNKDCNYLGYERSYYLASLFGDRDERWPSPSFIYAMGRVKRKSHVRREIETVKPLSQKAHVKIQSDFYKGDEKRLAADIRAKLQSGNFCGRLAVISWDHSDMGLLASTLGCSPTEGCPSLFPRNDFDTVWQLKYSYGSNREISEVKSSSIEWSIYGTLTHENFDPLSYSKNVGDYPFNGTNVGGRWATEDV